MGAPKAPKEDPEDKKARELERQKSLWERRRASEKSATRLTTDMQSVYGLRGLSMFGTPGTATAPKTVAPKAAATNPNRFAR
jgi:hypothetical protein